MPEIITDLNLTDNLQPLLKQLESEIERSQRYGHGMTVAVIRIDELDELRKSLGQTSTDTVLNIVANILISNLDHRDICARLDDQSFIVMFSESSAAHAADIAQEIKEKIDSHIITYNWQNIKASVSIGLASYPTHGNESNKLIEAATAAAKFALNGGGNRIVIA